MRNRPRLTEAANQAYAARPRATLPSYLPGDRFLFASELYEVESFEPSTPVPGYRLVRIGPGLLDLQIFIPLDRAEIDLRPMA